MDEISKSVAHNVKTGEYFDDARKWYNQKYIHPVTERSFIVLVFIVTSLAFLVVLYTFNAIFPVRREVPFVVKVEDSIDYFSVIKPLIRDNESPQQALNRHLIENYVTAYESYSFKDIAKLEARIRGSSTKRVYKAYSSFMSTTNPESPLLLYQRTSSRHIKILSTEIVQDESGVHKATVRFSATLDDRIHRKKTTTTYKADITFLVADINKVTTKKEPFEFIVTDYQARQIK